MLNAHPKTDKRTITAEELYKPNKPLATYGRSHWEVSLRRGGSKLFENTDRGALNSNPAVARTMSIQRACSA